MEGLYVCDVYVDLLFTSYSTCKCSIHGHSFLCRAIAFGHWTSLRTFWPLKCADWWQDLCIQWPPLFEGPAGCLLFHSIVWFPSVFFFSLGTSIQCHTLAVDGLESSLTLAKPPIAPNSSKCLFGWCPHNDDIRFLPAYLFLLGMFLTKLSLTTRNAIVRV